ncbi:polymerase I and transcript release factor [Hippocampus comes]|uniref:Caveolae associated protein 1 n=1 Tax=Hippocampus comes TaxID=109280 RepID=A0A3Q2YQR6_HIPCM|nr:PREDICTED: polymerase I and transcript release factor-like [Hippocampus comes]
MADTGVQKEHTALSEVPCDDDDVALVSAAAEPAMDGGTPVEDGKSEAQMNGVMVLALLDKIIGMVDQIQQTQTGLEGRQETMEKSVSTIQGEISKLSKNHLGTSTTVTKMLDKVRKVSVNVKSVRSNLEKQAGQIKKLESNESELLKRRNFKVLIYQDQMKAAKIPKPSEAVSEDGTVEGLQQIPEEGGEGEGQPAKLNSDDEVEIEEIVEESRTKRLQRSTKRQVDSIKKAFSKEKMEKTKLKTKENLEKTKQRTRENLEKTRQKTRANLEKTKHNLEQKMNKLGTRMTPNVERRVKMKSSKEKVKKSLTPDHTVYARSKTSVYRVPPFTFYVKKIRDGAEEVAVADPAATAEETEAGGEENGLGVHVDAVEEQLVSVDSLEMEAMLKDPQLVTVEADHLEKTQRD